MATRRSSGEVLKNLELREESKRALVDCFKTFDSDADGYIGIDELPEALSFAGIHLTDEDISDILRLFDNKGEGKLNIQDLVNNYHILAQHSVNGEELIDAFKRLDTNGDGYLNLPELKKVLMETGEKWSQEEAGQLLQDLMKYDKNGDGKFDYVEFVTMYMGNMYPFKKPNIDETDVNENFKMTKTKAKPEHSEKAKPDTEKSKMKSK